MSDAPFKQPSALRDVPSVNAASTDQAPPLSDAKVADLEGMEARVIARVCNEGGVNVVTDSVGSRL